MQHYKIESRHASISGVSTDCAGTACAIAQWLCNEYGYNAGDTIAAKMYAAITSGEVTKGAQYSSEGTYYPRVALGLNSSRFMYLTRIEV